MQLVIKPTGVVWCLYAEILDLHALGLPSIRRASHVEPDQYGRWLADLGPVGGPQLGPFMSRSEALHAEREWLESHWLADTASKRAI